MVFERWAGDGSAARSIDLTQVDALDTLADFYGSRDSSDVVTNVLSRAYGLGAQTAVVEQRYVDPDYRNEHSRFYSTTFRRYPSVAHRVHFFESPISAFPTQPVPFHFRNQGYLGYTVFRPVPAAPVGRTMLKASPQIEKSAIACLARDRVNLLGTDLDVTGIPFYAQDAQLSRCGHAALLSAGYYHHLTFGRPRYLPGDIADAVAAGGGWLGRLLPSPGVNIAQLCAGAFNIGLPALHYPVEQLPRLPGGGDLEATVCRYLNSRIPVVVATRTHAFLLVGYERRDNPDGGQDIRFLRQDDEVGPYEWVDQWQLDDRYGPWEHLVVPLPSKVYLSGEDAEVIGTESLREALGRSDDAADSRLLNLLDDPQGPVSYRATIMPANDYKRGVRARHLPDAVAAMVQQAQLSRYIWVVELTDRAARDNRGECVLAEVVIDTTDHARDPHPLLWRIPSGVGLQPPDAEAATFQPGLRSEGPTLAVVDTFLPHQPISP